MVTIQRIAATMMLGAIAAKLNDANAADADGSSSSNSSSSPTVGDKSIDWYKCTEFSTVDAGAGRNPWEPRDDQSKQAECAVIRAPLCYEGVCESKTDREIDLFVKRYVSGGTTKGKPNIIIMQGGPGAASPTMESAMANINKLLKGKVNAYTMDHRGTGRSTRLDCAAAQAQTSGSPSGESIALEEVAECAKELQSKYDGDLTPFSVTSAASDLKYFISTYLAGEETYVYGVSYGTLLTERLMHLNPPGIKGYILDGVATTSGAPLKDALYMSKWDESMDAVGKMYMDLCSQDQDYCGKYFPNSLVTATTTMLKTLDDPKSTCSKSIQSRCEKAFQLPGIGAGECIRQLFSVFIEQDAIRGLIPVTTHRLTRCDGNDLLAIGNLIDFIAEWLMTPREESLTMSSNLLYGLIVYSELWESPSPTKEQADARFWNASIASRGASVERYCAFTKEANTDACKDFHAKYGSYDATPISYKKDKYFNVAASPPANVSVLMLSGKLDPQTPHKFAEKLYEVIDTKNKKLIAFEYAVHGTLWNTPMQDSYSNPFTCATEILGSYISKKGELATLDTSCLSRQARFTFRMDGTLVGGLLGVDMFTNDFTINAAYDGKAYDRNASPERSTEFQTPLIAMSVALGLALIAMVVVIRKLRRERSMHTKNVSTEENGSSTATQEPAYQEAVDLEAEAPPQQPRQ